MKDDTSDPERSTIEEEDSQMEETVEETQLLPVDRLGYEKHFGESNDAIDAQLARELQSTLVINSTSEPASNPSPNRSSDRSPDRSPDRSTRTRRTRLPPSRFRYDRFIAQSTLKSVSWPLLHCPPPFGQWKLAT